MTMSDAEVEAARYAARDRDFVATAGLSTQVEVMQLKTGQWRAYLRDFVTPGSPRGQEAEDKEVVRDNYGYIITEPTREQLVVRLRQEYPGWKWAKKPLYPHVPKRKGPLFPHVPPRSEKLYQRGPDGYPVGSDRRLREAYGPIPDPDQPFWSAKGFVKPAEIYGWQWSDHFHRWTAFVRFPDGLETWTYPQHRAEGSLKDFLAKTEGDPITKYCCSQCGECAPEELLEEGRFFDRITWLREHYQEKHPGMWGEMSPMTIEGGELVKPEHRYLLDMVDEPLPPEAY